MSFELRALPGIATEVSDEKKRQTEVLLGKATQLHLDRGSQPWLPIRLIKGALSPGYTAGQLNVRVGRAPGASHCVNAPHDDEVQPGWGSPGQGQRALRQKALRPAVTQASGKKGKKTMLPPDSQD